MEIIYFLTFVDSNLKENKFEDEVISILGDENGWKKYNYNFICINDWLMEQSSNSIYKIVAAAGGSSYWAGGEINSQYPILKIFLKSARQTNKDCGMKGFSCTRFKDNYIPIDIIINYDNWCGKSKSSLPISEYRKYVINHEVGHWLGLDHTECPINKCKEIGLAECPASIMQQMTRGPKHIWPCKEQPYPLDHIFKIDNPKTSKYRFLKEGAQQGAQQGGAKLIKASGTKLIKGGTQKKQRNEYKYLIILIIILLIFFIIIYYIYIKNLKIGHITIFK